MVFGSGEFRFHLFSPEPPRKVSGFLSEMPRTVRFSTRAQMDLLSLGRNPVHLVHR